MMNTSLETDRLLLRSWQDDDYAPFAAMNQDARVMEFFPALWSTAESHACIERFRRAHAENGWAMWAAELKATGAFIGFIGLNIPSYPLPFDPGVEIGWRLAHPYWGQGLATEGATAALQFGFKTLNLDRIIAFTPTLNLRSEAVMRKIGMVNTHANFRHPKVPDGHRLQEHLLYQTEPPI